MKRIFAIFMTGLPVATFAQAPTSAASIWEDPMILFYVTTGFVLVVSLLVVAVAFYMLQVLNTLVRKESMARAEKLGITYEEEPGLWTKFNQWITDSVPVEKEETILLDHNYDGIRELDNHLPPWWKWLLYGSMIWAVVYLFVYHVTDSLPLSKEEYNREVAQAQEQIRKLQVSSGTTITAETVEAVNDPVALADGKSTFTSICASCHRPDGGGDIGPNLTDAYWKHGGAIKDLFVVITNGVPSTNMVAWGGSMSPEKIRNVASYVLTLQGSNPPNAKKPEGDLYQPKTPAAPADSTTVQASF